MATIRANKAYLDHLGLFENKVQLHLGFNAPAKKPTRGMSAGKRSSPWVDLPVRRSGRLRGTKPAGFYIDSETTSTVRFAGPDGVCGGISARDISRELGSTRVIPEVLTLDSTSTTDKHGIAFFDSLRELNANAITTVPISETVMAFAKKISNLDIDCGQTVAKVVPERIYSCAFHPSSSKVVAVAGDKEGHVGFWDVDAVEEAQSVFVYRPHFGVICALQFLPGDASKLWSWSYDCNVRCMDSEKQEFRQMFLLDEHVDGWLQHGCISEGDPNSMFVSTSSGRVKAVDLRLTGPGHRAVQWTLQAHFKKCNTVHACPANSNWLATAALDGSVKVWDVRKVVESSQAYLASFEYRRSINSAFFNLTGTHLLAVTQNNTLCIYPESCWSAGRQKAAAEGEKLLPHDNQTGRWLSTFHGVWNPRAPHAFLVGSMQQPRCLEVYTADGGGRRIGVLRGDCLTSVCSRNCWHPGLDVACGGNSSGRLHIFR
eukprot:GGOE01052980.1.p1 GENE.GGOE01052980.1~~GGOE01052980.1.p1  ORF type:complete len:559 (+),score=95.10 GGOE01052980.1:219-1679(+)